MKKLTKQNKLDELLKEIQLLIPAGEGKHYEIENAPCYGGYRLVKVSNDNGGHFGAFGGNGCEARINFAAMIEKLNTIIETAKLMNNHCLWLF